MGYMQTLVGHIQKLGHLGINDKVIRSKAERKLCHLCVGSTSICVMRVVHLVTPCECGERLLREQLHAIFC